MPKPSQAVATYGDWQVFPDGEIRNPKRQIRIYPDRLREPDWWIKLHLAYPWMAESWNTFMPALFKACKIAGIDQLTLSTQP